MSDLNDLEMTLRIQDEVILPALREAISRAREISDEPSVLLNSTVQSFGAMLFQLIGPKAAAHLLHGLADHIAAHDAGGEPTTKR